MGIWLALEDKKRVNKNGGTGFPVAQGGRKVVLSKMPGSRVPLLEETISIRGRIGSEEF